MIAKISVTSLSQQAFADREAVAATTAYIYRASLGRVTANMGIGALALCACLLLHPAVEVPIVVPTLAAGIIAWIGGRYLTGPGLSAPLPAICYGACFRRPLAIILIGASLAAVVWSFQDLAWTPLPLVLGFISRWILYVLEVRDIQLLDFRKIALPSLATRVRLWITIVTGAVIPTLVLLGLQPLPLLSLSFLMTLFAQWSSVCELALEARH